ncbi:RNA 2'-phosphotransferase [Vibrio sp. D431a]|uniref:RNA 2'-phosphotransferase n=1 Tax=Vibrio sp. D431a TaxID=2837388 RepID=UPI002556D8DB|nr:RNA 2'-phosphotransferase [Vibrio sp. D431a]MDK9790180.1 RNA 2'-phosphotransferase [Vibrio sp. D431a]
MLSKSKNNSYGKLLSWILRHRPDAFDLEMDANGWVEVSSLLDALDASVNHPSISKDELVFVIESDSEDRFGLSKCGNKVRCRQGHSVGHVKSMEMNKPERFIKVFHGTSKENYEKIKIDGAIKSMGRNEVHMHTNLSKAVKSGSRYGEPVVLEVDTQSANDEGIEFKISENGVWLADEIPTKFIRERCSLDVNVALGSDFHIEEALVFQSKRSQRRFIGECLTFPDLPKGTDILVLAGDICELKKIDLYRRLLDHYVVKVEHIVVVCGNHEFWGGSYQSGLEKLEILKEEYPNVHFLENEEVNIYGIRIFGATMWCNYDHDTYLMSQMNTSYSTVKNAPLDAKRIKWRNKYGGTSKGKAEHLYILNKKSVKALESFLTTVDSKDRALLVSHFPLVSDKVRVADLPYDWAGTDLEMFKGKENLQMAHGHLHCKGSYVNQLGQNVWLNPRGIVNIHRPIGEEPENYSLIKFAI